MQKSVLVTDLDNTLYDWFDVWYRCFDVMLSKVTEISGVPRTILIKEIRPVHQKHGTSEYAFLLESLPSLQKLYGKRDAVNYALDDAIHAYRSARKKYLQLYPTVMDTLVELKQRGSYIVAHTESQAYYSALRIKRLNLDGIIDVLFSPADHEVPIKDSARTAMTFKKTIQNFTPRNELKPNPKLLLDIITIIGARPVDCVYIGDSEMKDIEMAQRAGISDVFARYGNDHFKDNIEAYDLLRAVTHWTNIDVERERNIKESAFGAKPTHSVDSFRDLLSLFEFVQFKAVKNV